MLQSKSSLNSSITFLLLLSWILVSICQAGSIQTSLTLGSDDLSATTSYTFDMQVSTILTEDYHFILEFASDLGVSIPNSALACTGIKGFTSSNVPCLKLTRTQIRVNCFTCDLSSHPNYKIRIDDITNPSYSLPTASTITVSTFDESTIIDSSFFTLEFDSVPLPKSAVSITSTNSVTG